MESIPLVIFFTFLQVETYHRNKETHSHIMLTACQEKHINYIIIEKHFHQYNFTKL